MTTFTVLGANGRLANAVAKAAVEAGFRTIAVTRDGTLRYPIEGAELRAADAMDERSLVAACADADLVFNGLNPVYTDWADKALPMARNVLTACRAAGAVHLFPGNVYNFGETMPRVLTAKTPAKPTCRKGAIRVEMEEAFEAAMDVQTVILRAGDFYGGIIPGSWFDLMVGAKVAKGAITYPGPMDRMHAWAYLPDLAQVFIRLAAVANTLPPFARFGFEGHTMTGAEMKVAMEQTVERKLKTKGVPWWLVRTLGLVQPMMREVAEMAYLWRVPHRLDGSALEAAIGPVAVTPPEEALRAALADLKA